MQENKKTHICLTGSQGTGKTSIRKNLEFMDEFKDFDIMDEITRKLIKEGKLNIENVNKNSSDEVQQTIFNQYIDIHINNDKYISDRCALDPLAYTLYMLEHNGKEQYDLYYDQYDKLITLIKEGHLNTIFYLPIEFEIEKDDVREDDEQFQKDIDINIKFIISQLTKDVKDYINIYELTGSIEERSNKIIKIMSKTDQ